MARDIVIQNPDILLENMALLRDTLGKKGIRLFLHYGTLLGAIRERGFIPHDNDADLGAFMRDFDAVLDSIPYLASLGFEFNSQRLGRLLQFTRKGEQVDIFFASEKRLLFRRVWSIDDRATVPARHLDALVECKFLGQLFLIPSYPDKLMENLYGKTWKIPLKDIPSRTDWTWKFVKILNSPLSIFKLAARYLRTTVKKSINK